MQSFGGKFGGLFVNQASDMGFQSFFNILKRSFSPRIFRVVGAEQFQTALTASASPCRELTSRYSHMSG